MKLKDLLMSCTPLPWNPSGMSGPKTQGEIHNNSRYALHSANVLPELVEALQQADKSLSQHGNNANCWPRKEIRAALSKAENIKDK